MCSPVLVKTLKTEVRQAVVEGNAQKLEPCNNPTNGKKMRVLQTGATFLHAAA
jgi:hypothetical protein